MFGHSHHYYLDRFKELGLPIRSNKINSRKYTANFSYFNEIDSHEKAYWLGYIYADGYISNANNRKLFGMSLGIKDREQLEKLNKCLDSTYPLHEYSFDGYKPDTRYVRLIVESGEIFDGLLKQGVFTNKTNILKPPPINPVYYPSFILGYFDGDGSIYLNNGRSPFYTINIVGTNDILTFIHNYLVNNNITSKPINLEKRKKHQTVSYIRYGGNIIVEKIMSLLYSKIDLNLPLQRKYNLYLKCKERNFT